MNLSTAFLKGWFHTIRSIKLQYFFNNILKIFNFWQTMSSQKQLEVQYEDRSLQKWLVPLREATFDSFISRGSPIPNKVFGKGTLFSPMLFGKFFDPSDHFPLWEFESKILLSDLRNSVDWFETDTEYGLKAELQGVREYDPQVCVDQGKVVEIYGQWRQQQGPDGRDWRSGQWWEFGYVRRLELPENADWRKIEAIVDDESFLEIRIPKNPMSSGNIPQGNDVSSKVSEFE